MAQLYAFHLPDDSRVMYIPWLTELMLLSVQNIVVISKEINILMF
jgi:hypothetical protein